MILHKCDKCGGIQDTKSRRMPDKWLDIVCNSKPYRFCFTLSLCPECQQGFGIDPDLIVRQPDELLDAIKNFVLDVVDESRV